MAKSETELQALQELLEMGKTFAEGSVWSYRLMDTTAKFAVRRRTNFLNSLRGKLEREGYYFTVQRAVGWCRCAARDMLLWDAKEHRAAARRAKRALARLRAINPLSLGENERPALLRKIGLWTVVQGEHEREAATILKKAKRMRKPKRQPSHPPIPLAYQPPPAPEGL